MQAAEWSRLLSNVAITIEYLFIPWHLLALVIVGRAVRDPETGEIQPVTLGLFVLMLLGLCHTGVTLWLLYRVALPLDLLIVILLLDAGLITARTYFMWHLQLKALFRKDD